MAVFESEAETLALGGPVVRLFRTGLGRDPDPEDLADYVARLRQGAGLDVVAERLAATEEFRLRHGPGAAADAAFVQLVCAELVETEGSEGDPDQAGRIARLAAELGASRSEILAVLANSPLGRARIPVLPGIAPGAPPDDPLAYRIWVDQYDSPDPEALTALSPLSGPLVTVAMLAGDTTAEGALRSAESLRRQVYPHWELRLGVRFLAPWPRAAVERLAREESRVVLFDAGPYAGRTEQLNQALFGGSGALACLLAPGDRLAPTALHEVVACRAGAVLIYTDEDRLDGDTRSAPRFKPDVSVDAMRAGDALGQLAVYDTDFLRRLGGLRAAAAPHEMHDLASRAVAAAAGRIRHVPAVLCHRADRPPPDAAPAPAFSCPAPAPRVSVIVPTRDHAALLSVCAAGVLERTDYPQLELLIVDNASTEAATLALLAGLASDRRVRVLRRAERFNFAALNNAAVAEAAGDVLVLLNDDTEMPEPGWLAALVAHAMRPDVGVVGARLLYPSGTIQHAGILLGPRGAAVHVGRGAAADDPGYLGQLAATRELSAVTAACLAIRRTVWQQVGGMDERLAVTWNDVDLCLRVRAAGLRVLWTPAATLIHHEGATRGLDAGSAERRDRFEAERALMRETWGAALDRDPFLNPNLVATEAGPLALTRPRTRRPWERA